MQLSHDIVPYAWPDVVIFSPRNPGQGEVQQPNDFNYGSAQQRCFVHPELSLRCDELDY